MSARSNSSSALAGDSGRCAHVVQFYDGDDFLSNRVADFLAEGFTVGQPAVVIATEAHRLAFNEHLRQKGVDVDGLIAGGQFLSLDARETLAAFMDGSMPSAALFKATVGVTIAESLRRNAGASLRAYGEMVDLLWCDGNPEAAIALEELWNDLANLHTFSLLCAYNMGSFYKQAHADGFRQVCQTHTHVLPAESYTGSGDESDRLREIAVLQQQARSLQTEILQRKEVEKALRDALAERRQAEEIARRSQQEMQDFLDNAAEGLHWVAPDGVILWANQAELDLLGYSRDEYIGRNISEFHADADVIGDILTRLCRNETLREYEARMRCKDGSIRHVLISSNVLWENGKFVHTRCFTRDITALKRTEALLQEAIQARDEFLSIASHELRNPVHAIHLQLINVLRAARQARKPVSTDWIASRVERASEQVTRLARLLDNLLDVSRITAARIDLQIEEVDFAGVVQGVVERYAEALRGHEVSLQLKPVVGRWDKLRLDQMVTNLLSNAIKYGEGKPIEIALDVDPSNAKVCLVVTDHGVGIDPADHERLFTRFQRSASGRHYGGFGLGLWITRQFVEAMGGGISVTSEPGKGATFRVTLPR